MKDNLTTNIFSTEKAESNICKINKKIKLRLIGMKQITVSIIIYYSNHLESLKIGMA